MDIAMVTAIEVEPEQIDEIFLQRNAEDAKEAVLDGGAQSFVVGDATLERYMEYLRLHGIAWKTRTLTCQKYFRFGNDNVMCCTSTTVIPVNSADRAGQMYVHVLPGNTPCSQDP